MIRRQAHRLIPVAGCLALAAICGAATFDELARAAAAARDADRVPEAIGLYQQALQLQHAWPEGWFYLGTLYYDSDRYAEAEPAFLQFVKLSDKPAGWAFLGLCEFENGGFEAAREHLQKALDGGLAPEIEPVARFHLALTLTKLGLFDQALHWYQSVVRSGVHNPEVVAGLGLSALNRAMLPKETPPDQREFVAAAGQTVYTWMSGDKAATSAAFRTLLATYPSAPGVHYLHATYMLGTQPDAAIPELRRELEVDSGAVEARALLALLLLQAGEAAEADPYAKKAVDDRPTSPMAQYAYALTLDDPRQAAAHLETALKLDPFNFEYHVSLAHEYSRLGRNDEARRERRLSIQLARDSDPKSTP